MGSTYEPLEGKGAWDINGDHPCLSDAARFSGASFAEQDGLYVRRSQKVRNIASAPLIKEYKHGGGGRETLNFASAFWIRLCSAASAPSASARSLTFLLRGRTLRGGAFLHLVKRSLAALCAPTGILKEDLQ